AQRHAIADSEAQAADVLMADEDRVPRRAGQRIDLALDHRVELFAPPCREAEGRARIVVFRERLAPRPDGRKMRLAVRRRDPAIGVQRSPAPLNLIALGAEGLDAFVQRNSARNLVADCLRAFESDLRGTVGKRLGHRLTEDLPFGTGRPDPAAWNL